MEDKKKNKRPVDFASLYPTPKTYDELKARNKAAQVRWQKRQPKHVAILTSINLSVAMLVLTAVISDPSAFLYLGVISGVFFMFLAGLMWFGFVWWQAKRIAEFLNGKGYSLTPFLLTYFMSAVPLLASIYSYVRPQLDILFTYFLLVFLNICLILFIISTVIAKKISNSRKVAILTLTIILSFVFAMIVTII